MRFHWYWPFARPEELAWAHGTAAPGDSIVVQVIDRQGAPAGGTEGAVRVMRNLPDVERDLTGVSWARSRADTYVRRAIARRELWRSEDFDLVHLHYLNRFTDVMAPMPRPLVMSVHDVMPHQRRLGAAEVGLQRRLYRRGDALVVHHSALRDRLVSEFEVAGDRVHVVPHQVFPAPEAADPPSDQAPMVLFFGALRPNKGLEVLLDALRGMSATELEVVIAGRGDVALEALAREASHADPRIHAEIGFVTLERKQELFARASIVVLPYTSFASQSGVLHDAYAHGRPVVVSDVGALGVSVAEDGTGVVVPPSEPEALAEGIRAALLPSQWQRHAEQGARVRSERSPERTGARLRQVYEHVLSR